MRDGASSGGPIPLVLRGNENLPTKEKWGDEEERYFKASVVLAATLALCLLALVAARPAEAAFPRKNGKIAYHRLGIL